MNDIIVSFAVFHAVSSFTLMMGCAVTSLTPAPRRTTRHMYIDQMQLDADTLLSTPVGTPTGYTQADVQTATTAAA